MTVNEYTMSEAAEYLGLSRGTLNKHVAAGKITPDDATPRRRRFRRETLDAFAATNRPGAWLPPAVWEEISRRYRAGEPVETLAAAYHVTATRIKLKIGPRGPATRGKGKRLPKEAWDQILRRRAAGEFAAALAQEFGVSVDRIYRRAKAAG